MFKTVRADVIFIGGCAKTKQSKDGNIQPMSLHNHTCRVGNTFLPSRRPFPSPRPDTVTAYSKRNTATAKPVHTLGQLQLSFGKTAPPSERIASLKRSWRPGNSGFSNDTSAFHSRFTALAVDIFEKHTAQQGQGISAPY